MERLKESVIEHALEDACERRGWLCPKTASPGTPGFPDRIVVTNDGTVTFVEVKRPGEKPRKLQLKKFLRPLLQHRANVVVVSTTEQVDELIGQLEEKMKPEPRDDTTFYIKER